MTRDNAGRITRKVENIQGTATTWDYQYDQLGRLTEVQQNGSIVESYTYDANGNRLTETNALRLISNQTYFYSTEDHIITAGADTYQFDKDGFLKEKTTAAGTSTYNYSSRGELLNATLPDGRDISYVHDPMGRRVAKVINSTVVEKYLWQGITRLLAVYDGSNNLISRFNYADGRMPVSMTQGGNTYYLAYDQVGSLRAVMDSSGAIVKQVDYDSFGSIINDSNSGISVPFGFAGGLYDRETGLVRFGFRDYDPAIGKWTAKDPIDFTGGDANLFGYVGNNPVNFTDPEGLQNPAAALGWGWGIALAEPTPVGEVIMTGITIGVIGYEFYAKGERNWDSGKGDNPYYDPKQYPIDKLKEIERDKSRDWRDRRDAQEARKKREKKDKQCKK